MWRLRCALLLAVLAVVPVWAAAQQTTITLDQARQIARQALLSQNPQLALEIGKTLLEADPRDPDALLIVAAAQAQLGNPINGRRAAARAYRNTDNRIQKFDAATIAASLAARAERLTLSQVWLRRASLHTDDPAEQQGLARAYGRVRAQNPWRFNLETALRPSSNVNNGANTGEQIVDGIDAVDLGRLSASAQALSGVIAQADLELGYRLRGTAQSRTELATRVRIRRVDLSDEARTKANDVRQALLALGVPPRLIPPDPKNRGFGSTYADLTLRHTWRVGTAPGGTAMLAAGVGTYWYGTREEARLARMEARRTWALSEGRSFTLYGSLLRRDEVGSTASDSVTVGLLGSYAQRLENGAQWSAGLSVSDTRSDQVNIDSATWTVRTRYRFARKWGPAQASAGVSLTSTDYATYALIPGLFAPGGRQDEAAYADLTLFFEEYDYLGFAPEVTLRAGQRRSNVSRFDSEELSISVGIQSKF